MIIELNFIKTVLIYKTDNGYLPKIEHQNAIDYGFSSNSSVNVSSIEYVYDDKANVIKKTEDNYITEYVYDSNNNVKESNTTSLIINEGKFYCDVNFTSIFESDVRIFRIPS